MDKQRLDRVRNTPHAPKTVGQVGKRSAKAKAKRGPLTPRQKTRLRQHSHAQKPVLQIGKDGLSEGLLRAVDDALLAHELVKVKLLETVQGDRHTLAAQLCTAGRAELLQVIGRNVVLYRALPAHDPRKGLLSELQP